MSGIPQKWTTVAYVLLVVSQVKLFDDNALTVLALLEDEILLLWPWTTRRDFFINGESWRYLPSDIRIKYLKHHITMTEEPHTIFARFARPVFEREMERIHIMSNGFLRQRFLEVFCRLCMHEVWNISWIVLWARDPHKQHANECRYQEMTGSFSLGLKQLKRVGRDHLFLQNALGVLFNQQETINGLLASAKINPDRLNFLFGTTILGIALRSSTISTIKKLLTRVRKTKSRHLSVYLRLAAARTDAYEALCLLFDHFYGIASTRRDFARGQLIRAAKYAVVLQSSIGPIDLMSIKEDNLRIFNALMVWLQIGSPLRDKSQLIQEVFWLLNFKETCDKRYPQKEDVKILKQPVHCRHPAPSVGSFASFGYVFGAYYKHRHRTRLLTKSTKYFRQSCPCRQKYDKNTAPWRYCWCEWTTNTCSCVTALPKFERMELPLYDLSAIEIAASRGYLHWVDWLLWAGVNPTLRRGHFTILDYARKGGILDGVIRLLLAYNWDVARLLQAPLPDPRDDLQKREQSMERVTHKEDNDSEEHTVSPLSPLAVEDGQEREVEVWSASCPRSYLWVLYADGTMAPPHRMRWIGDAPFFSEYLLGGTKTH